MKRFLPVISFMWLSVLIILFSFHLLVAGQTIFLQYKAFADTPQLVLYDEQLNPQFTDWSWSSTRNLQASDQKQNGSFSLQFSPSPWGGLYFHTETQLDANQYDSLQVAIRGTADGQKLKVVVYDANNQIIGDSQPIEQYGGSIENGNWKTYSIPVSSLTPSGNPIKGIAFQEATGQNQASFYFDDIVLKGKPTLPSPTLAPQVSMMPTQTPQTTPGSSEGATYALYTDSLSSDMMNWSWDSAISLDQSTKVYQGSKAISFTANRAWAGLYLRSEQPVPTDSYQYISFTLQASSNDQKFSLILHDDKDTMTSSPLSLDNYGAVPMGSWKQYRIPLSDLNATNKQITGMIIQEASGHPQPTLYIDEITFVGTSVTVSQPVVQTLNTINTTAQVSESPFSSPLYRKANTSAEQTATSWRASGRTADADALMKIATQPTAFWIVGGDSYAATQSIMSQAEASSATPVLVSYNIPGRDCGQYSAGGSNAEAYKAWIGKMAEAIGNRKAAVILEPDALGLDCLQNETTYSLLRYAIDTLRAHPNTAVYIEASTWVNPDTMADRLKKVGIEKASGFAVNTSGFNTTDTMITLGTTISSKVGGKHFVIDTSRNGNGPYDQSQPEPWCNPPDRALGHTPTLATGNSLVDAYLWVKVPGESDGTCRGGPAAGSWWPEYALGLARRAQ